MQRFLSISTQTKTCELKILSCIRAPCDRYVNDLKDIRFRADEKTMAPADF